MPFGIHYTYYFVDRCVNIANRLFVFDLFAYCFDMAAVSVLLATSTIEEVRPAIPCISDGMMILVALPSAAFVNASRLFRVMT